MLSQLNQQLMLPQLAIGGLETAFNALIKRSPHVLPILRKLSSKVLHLSLSEPKANLYVIFSGTRTDWLAKYEGEADCCASLKFTTLPKLADKTKLSELINDKQLVLHGNIQILQHFATLLEQLEKDPAELLSPFVGDVIAQSSTDLAKTVLSKVKQQFQQNNQHLVENLLNERPILVHRLQLVNFYDEVSELEKRVQQLEKRLN